MTEQNTHHNQVSVYNPIDKSHIDVDEGIADVLKLIWDIGLATGYSCQERHDKSGMTMIQFQSVYAAEAFVTAVVRYVPKDINPDKETTYQRIIRHGCKECWEFEVSPERIEEGDDVIGIYFSATVYFPVDDLPEVLESLKQAVIEGFTFA